MIYIVISMSVLIFSFLYLLYELDYTGHDQLAKQELSQGRLLELGGIGYYRTDSRGKVLFSNEICRDLGISCFPDATGKWHEKLLSHLSDLENGGELLNKLSISQGVYTFESEIKNSFGKKLFFKHCLTSIEDMNGLFLGISGIVVDISEIKDIGAEDCSHSDHRNIFDNDLFDVFAHELRTPLAGMTGSLKVLEDSSLPIDIQKYVDKCNISVHRLKDTVDSFLRDICGKSSSYPYKIESTENRSTSTVSSNGSDVKKLSVLLAEDDIRSQVTMRRHLESWGHSVRTACNGLEVLNCIREQQYDLVLMDIQMPEMNGYEAIGMIRENESSNSQVPIIVMSAYGDDSDFKKMDELGVADFVSKPIRGDDLKSVIDLTLKKYEI
ncbi:hybrid sensor histidine kinase/response regulator [Maridesulfovibrio zosterae]|uniref:hybrid sensor histidine kinase/response regulator n=1 Tax=Maridesulfovibrio zosterae TaxID=82171 RepID=UPI00040B0E04|nr:response regulator [Maridesulfovibrio zosterae]